MPEHPFEFPEGLGEVLQLVMKVDVLLYQRVNRVLQFKAPTLQDQQSQRHEKKQHRSSQSTHSDPQHAAFYHIFTYTNISEVRSNPV